MNDCRELEPLLAPYVDGDAAAADRARIEAHVAACDCCRGRLAAERVACESLRTHRAALRACAPEPLKSRCAAFAARHPTVSPAVRQTAGRSGAFARRWVPLAAAATVLLLLAGGFGLGLTNKVHALALQATVDHMKCSRFNAGSSPADAVASAEQWQARFGWPIKVPASAAEGNLELRAVRRCAMTDGRVAHLMYLWQGEPLSVYVLPARVLDESPAFARQFGHDAVIWTQNDRTYVLVSDRRRDASLDGVVSYVRANAY